MIEHKIIKKFDKFYDIIGEEMGYRDYIILEESKEYELNQKLRITASVELVELHVITRNKIKIRTEKIF